MMLSQLYDCLLRIFGTNTDKKEESDLTRTILKKVEEYNRVRDPAQERLSEAIADIRKSMRLK